MTIRTVTIRNDFHNTECTLRATDNKLSPSQVKRCRKTLCGFHDCTCAEGPLGERGPQDVIYSYTMDNNGGYHVEFDRED
jgi:hypothetical protein